ncbi:unnamed protein product [Macrosiphum euphorbiae]|nr:unnamed protein product [Macrosiphum euphorbiae]
MKRLTAITCVAILLLLKLKGFDCKDNTTIPAPTLILPPSTYPPSTSDCCSYGGMTSSQLALLSARDDLAPPEDRVHAIVLLINALPTAPYSLSCLSTETLCCVLNELARRPSLMTAIEPPNVVCLFDTLCALQCLMRVVPDRTIRDLITAAMLSPEIVKEMRPSTVVCLLSKAPPTALCALSPAIRELLIHCALSPNAIGRLTPVEISNFFDALMCTERSLARSTSTTDLIELLSTNVLSSSFANNISATRAVDLLCLMSKSTMVRKDLVDALLATIASSAHRLPPVTHNRLIAILTCSPYSINSMDPATVALLLAAWSPASVLSTCPPNVLVRLLVVLSQATAIAVDEIIGLLYGVTCSSPSLMCDVPACVRSAYVIRFTSPEMTATLSIKAIVKLIGILSKNQCFMTELTASSLNLTMTFMVSNDTIFKAFQLSDIVDLFHALVGTGCALQDISLGIIQKLLSVFDSVFSRRVLDTACFSKLLSCFCRSPYLTSAMSGTQLVNVLETMTSVSSSTQAIPNSAYVNMMTQLMTTPYLMSNIPFATLLNCMKQIESHTSGSVFCAMPPCVIDKYTEFLGANNASIITSLPPTDLKALVGFLTDVHCFLAQLPVKTLSALLEAIYASSIAIPLEVRMKIIFAITRLPPSVMSSLPPESIGNICKSFSSFDVLQGGLSTTCLRELLTAISTYPCLLSAFDPPMIQDFLEYLSTSQCMLNYLEPCDVTNLVISMSADAHLKTVMPVGSFVRFLCAVNGAMPCSCSIPTTAAVALLESLTSMDVMMDGLTLIEAANLRDLFIRDNKLLAASSPIMINLLKAITNRFAGMPCESIVHLLAATHLASPCMLCTVPEDVLADMLKLICTQSAVGCLPSKYLAVFMAVLSTTPCLMTAMSASGLETLIGLLLSQPALTAEVVPPHTLPDFCTTLALTQSHNVNVSTIILLLSSVCPKSVCDIPAMALSTLLEPLSDAKIVYELGVTTTASLLWLATSSPCVLEVLSGPTLNTIVVKLASSPNLIQHLQPDILQCFVSAVVCSRPGLESLPPTTIAHLLKSIAEGRPCVLSTMSPATATALLGAFSSQHAFASLSPPALDFLIGLLVKFSNLLHALPLSVLNDLFLFFASTPASLGSVLSCTLLEFLNILSSMTPLLRALPSSTLIAFIEELCIVSPKYLCACPATVVTALFNAVAAGSALATLTPCTVASLVSAFDTSPCLIPILPAPLLPAFLAYLAKNPCLLCDTPKPKLLAFVRNVQSPGSIPPVVFPVGCCLPCVTIDHFSDVSANNNSSCCSGEFRIPTSGNTTESSNAHPNPIIIHPGNENGTSTVWCFPKKKINN